MDFDFDRTVHVIKSKKLFERLHPGVFRTGWYQQNQTVRPNLWSFFMSNTHFPDEQKLKRVQSEPTVNVFPFEATEALKSDSTEGQ